MAKLKIKQKRSHDPAKFRGKLVQMRLNETEHKAIIKYIAKKYPETSVAIVLRQIIFNTIKLPNTKKKRP